MVFSGLVFVVEANGLYWPVWIDKNKNWVNDSGDLNYTTIQTAINDANPYDWIGVNASLYNPTGNFVEHVVVNVTGLWIKSINGITLVNASGTGKPVFNITAIDDVIIEGFNTTQGNHGIYVKQANNCSLIKNNATYNGNNGIYICWDSNNCSLIENQAYNNEYNGIELEITVNCSLTGNKAYNNRFDGIYIEFSANCSLTENKAYNNRDGIVVGDSVSCSLIKNQAYNNEYGIFVRDSDNCNLIRNNVYNNTDNGIEIGDSVNSSLTENLIFNNTKTGIWHAFSNQTYIVKNKVYNNSDGGIGIISSINCSLIENDVYNNMEAGIGVGFSFNCVILNNLIINNTGHGVWLLSSNRIYVVGNTIINNTSIDSGIHVDDESIKNKIHYNNILNNTAIGSYGVFDEAFPATSATYNWWGDSTGPYNETTNPSGLGDAVGGWVDYKPWLNASITKAKYTVASNTGTLDALDEANVTVYFDTAEPVEIYVANYTGNPVEDLAVPSLNRYIDLFINQTDGVNQLEIRLYYTDEQIANLGISEEDLTFYWWNGNEWIECSNSGVNTVENYVWMIVTATTIPNIQDLTGTIFAPAGKIIQPKPPVGGKVIPTNLTEILTPWITIILLLTIILVKTTLKPKKHF